MTPISLGLIKVATPGTPVGIDLNFAAVVGYYPGTSIAIGATSDKLKIAVDGGSDQTITLTTGTWDAAHVCSEINAQATGLHASVTSRGQIYIASSTRTTSSSLVIKTISNSAYAVLGLTVGAFASLPDEICAKIVLRPLPGNVGPVYVGVASNFNKTSGLDLIDVLIKDSSSYVDRFIVASQQDSNILHSVQYWLDADTANDGVVGSVYVE